jgi:hypothetical protein
MFARDEDGRMSTRLPIFRYGEVVAFALIDEEDFVALAGFRWGLHRKGYAHSGTPRRVYMHREIFGLVPGDGLEVDHINTAAKLDNRRSNLRVVTPAQNAQNVPLVGGSSRYRGVSWNKQKGTWTAQAVVNGTKRHLGYFDDEDEAGAAARQFREVHLPFAVEVEAST